MMGPATAVGSSCSMCTVLILVPVFAWEKINLFKWGGGAKNCFDLHQ